MPPFLRRFSFLFGAFLVIWINSYIIRDVFFLDYTSHMNSMHGFWMALARLDGFQLLHSNWWPFLDAGAPLEYVYAPFTPALVSLYSHLAHLPIPRSFYSVTALYYILGPLTLYALAAWLTRSALAATAAALCYSLFSPSSFLIPDFDFAFRHLLSDRRAFLMGAWDETPHIGALVLLPILCIFLYRALEHRRPVDVVLAVLLMALETYASAFGPVLVVLSGICIVATLPSAHWRRHLATFTILGALAYLLALPALPPSLIANMSENARIHGEGSFTAASLTALSLVLLAWVLVTRLLQRFAAPRDLRFAAYFALVTAAIPAIWVFLGRSFVPQPVRYRMEMDLACALLLAILARVLWRRMPRAVAAAVACVLLSLGAEQVVQHRRFAKETFAPADITRTVEYQAARFLDSLPPGARVFVPGSMATWFNAFSDREQLSGSSFSTAYNQPHQLGIRYFYSDAATPPEKVLLWLRAYGVQALAVPGKNSPETWHAVHHPEIFSGILTPVWNQQDTTIYTVPLQSLSLAHVVQQDAIVPRTPGHGDDTADLARFVSALQDPALPAASFSWRGRNDAVADTTTSPGQAIAIQVSYHPGWHARLNGSEIPLHPDGLGLMWLRPATPGPAHLELHYDGGPESKTCRALSVFALILLALYATFHRRLPSPLSPTRP